MLLVAFDGMFAQLESAFGLLIEKVTQTPDLSGLIWSVFRKALWLTRPFVFVFFRPAVELHGRPCSLEEGGCDLGGSGHAGAFLRQRADAAGPGGNLLPQEAPNDPGLLPAVCLVRSDAVG